MAITYVGGAIQSKGGSTTVTTTLSLSSLSGGIGGAVLEGDLVIASFTVASNADRPCTITDGSTDYTLIGTKRYILAPNYDVNLRVAYKFMGATPDSTVSFGPTGANTHGGVTSIRVYRGVDPTTPLDVAAVETSATGVSIPNPGSITPVTSGAMVVAVGAQSSSASAVFTSSDLNEFQTARVATTYDSTLGVGHIANWTSGAVDPAAFGGGDSGSADSVAASTIALRPGASSATATPTAGAVSVSGYAPSVSMGGTATFSVLTQAASNTNATSVDTASITVTAGKPVFVFFMDSGATTASGTSRTISGAGQTWTEIDAQVLSGSDSAYDRFQTYYTSASSGGSGALTLSGPTSQMRVWSVVEVDPAGGTVSLGTPESVQNPTGTSTSKTLSASADYWLAMSAYYNSSGTPQTATPTSGWTELSDNYVLDPGGSQTAGLEVQVSPQGGDTSMSVAWTPTSGLDGLALVGFPLTVSGSAGGGVNATPSVGAVTATGAAPTATASAAASPTTGAASVTGFAVTASAGGSIEALPGVGAVSIAGHAPSASSGALATSLSGSVGVAGYAPTASAGASVTASLGGVTVLGYAPTAYAGADVAANTGMGAVSVLGYAPTVAANAVSGPGLGIVDIAGHAPTASAGGVAVDETPQPGGFLPIIYVDAQGRPVDINKVAEQAVRAAPAKERKEVRAAAKRIKAAVRQVDTSGLSAALAADFARMSLALEKIDLALSQALAAQAEQIARDDELAILLLLAA